MRRLVVLGGGTAGTMVVNRLHRRLGTDWQITVPDVPEFLAQIVDSGGHLWACRLSAEMVHLQKDDLYDPVEGIISASDFIEMTEGAQLLFI